MPARNISEYPQLLNAIHSAEKIVYLCGAGASMSIGSHRLSWTNWIAEGRKYLTIPEQNELNLKIGSWTAEESYHNCWLWWHDGRSEPVWLYVICV